MLYNSALNEDIMPEEKQITLRTVDALIKKRLVPEQARAPLEEVSRHYATAIPPAFQDCLTHPDDPIGRQVIPDPREMITQPYERVDPIGDEALSPVKGIVHRYADRALLKPLLICPLYCRFCFRREHVGPDGGVLGEETLEKALNWIEDHTEIREIIMTGGDPFMLSSRRMGFIIRRLSSISHITTIRIHTRVPFAAPERISTDFLDSLETDRALWVAVHANHAQEFSPRARQALTRMLKRGIPLVSQSVLLRGVNDSVEALENLLRAFVEARVKPYYLHHLDAAPGTSHFQVPVEEAHTLLRALRGRVTGLAWPVYVLDIPGGKGKVPLGPDYLLPDHPLHENSAEKPGELQYRQAHAPDGRVYPFSG